MEVQLEALIKYLIEELKEGKIGEQDLSITKSFVKVEITLASGKCVTVDITDYFKNELE